MSPPHSAKIGVATATIIGMNAMIGSGIFTAPAAMAAHVGPAGILAYIFVVLCVWSIALSLARLAALFPQEGSFYTYTKEWGGHAIGMLAGITYMIGLIIAMGLLSRISGIYLHTFFPALQPNTLGIIALTIMTLLNSVGVALSQIGQHILIVCTVFPLLTITGMCFSHFDINNLLPFAPYGLVNALKATRIVIFGFFGFECAASLFAVVQNPEKNVPRALTYSIAFVGLLYTLFISSLISSVPIDYFSDPSIPLSTTLEFLFPDKLWLITIIHFAILSAILGTIHSMIWSSSALLVSLMKISETTKKMFKDVSAKKMHSLAVFTVGIAIFLAFHITQFNTFFSLTAIAIVFSYIMSMITLLTLKQEWKSGRNIITLFGIVTALAIFYFAAQDLYLSLTM